MKFIIEGADAKTGKDRRLELDAEDENSAAKLAKAKGVFPYRVSEVYSNDGGPEFDNTSNNPPPVMEANEPPPASRARASGAALAIAVAVLIFFAVFLYKRESIDQQLEQNRQLLRETEQEFAKTLIKLHEQPNEAPPNSRFTYNNYLAIKEGMYPENIEMLLMSFSPIETLSSGDMKTLIWRDGKRQIICIFRENKLVLKSQSGLD